MTDKSIVVSLRAGGQLVDGVIVRRFLFMRLVAWKVRESWDGCPPYRHYTKVRWRPYWRMCER